MSKQEIKMEFTVFFGVAILLQIVIAILARPLYEQEINRQYVKQEIRRD